MPQSEQPTADAWRAYAETLQDALWGMWEQFAYQADDGTLYTGGLSALEECEHALNTPAPTTDADRHAAGGTALYGDADAAPEPLPFDDVDGAEAEALSESAAALRAALRRDVQVRNLVLTWELHGAQLPQPYQRRGTLIAAIHRLLEAGDRDAA